MKAFIQAKEGMPANTSFFAAYLGFKEMGSECVLFHTREELKDSSPSDIVVGGAGIVEYALSRYGIELPPCDYPDALQPYLGRLVWKADLGDIINSSSSWPIFVKPQETKLFTGRVVSSATDLIGIDADPHCGVICSEVVEFVAEWRCFVRYGQIIDVRPYRGDWRAFYDPLIVESCVGAYTNAPAAYAADFGVTASGETLLVEINDGYALGSYGLQHNLYAQFLSARWAQLTGTPDEFNYL